jgi:hypothetical protein
LEHTSKIFVGCAAPEEECICSEVAELGTLAFTKGWFIAAWFPTEVSHFILSLS